MDTNLTMYIDSVPPHSQSVRLTTTLVSEGSGQTQFLIKDGHEDAIQVHSMFSPERRQIVSLPLEWRLSI